MSTENLAVDTGGDVGPSFSQSEQEYFDKGGEASIPAEEAAPAEPVVEPAADAKKVEGEGDKAPAADPKHVPLAALHEERTKRKALGSEVETLKTQLAEQSGKLAILLKLKGEGDGKTDAPAGPPSPEDDIFGAVKHVGETVAQMQKRLDDDKKATEEANKAATEQQTFVNNYRADADAFQAKTADYRDAYNHLLNSRASELIAIGFDNPAELQKNGADIETVQAAAKALHDALIADEFAIAQRALSAKKSPAAIIYDLAKQRGYAKKAADGKPPGAETLDRIERGQQTNKSLSDVGGDTGSADMTAERLLDLPMAEFEAWTTKHPAKARALLGG